MSGFGSFWQALVSELSRLHGCSAMSIEHDPVASFLERADEDEEEDVEELDTVGAVHRQYESDVQIDAVERPEQSSWIGMQMP